MLTLKVFVVCILAGLMGFAQAEEVGVVADIDVSVAVDVITEIDQDTRTVTLKDESGEKWTFVAGPEVQNFAQLERGDLVMLGYYSGFAFALEPKGSGLKQRAAELNVERAAAGEKPGVVITESIYVEGKVAAVDVADRLVALEGPENVLVLKVDESRDLSAVEAGQEVEILYQQAYAIEVVEAPKVSGTVKLKTKAVALGVGIAWGEGSLVMYDGTEHEFKVSGLTVLDVGVAEIEAEGEVFKLVEAADLEGTFIAGEAAAVLGPGAGAVAMKNSNGVVMKLKSTQKGVRLTLAGEGMKISMK